jgi:hypothetical protein
VWRTRCRRACRNERWGTPDGVVGALATRGGSGCNRTSGAALTGLPASAAPSIVLWIGVGHCVVVVGGVQVRVLGSGAISNCNDPIPDRIVSV